ncbi:MAG TPA: hypothetical protein VLD58_14640 [Gemmatimonadales bacterium]|nr:hypothetical protein [Gemmatimonadales bacterium]
MPTPLTSDDSAERAQFLKLLTWFAPTGFILLTLGETLGFAQGRYGGAVYAGLLLLNLPILFLMSLLLFWLITRSASGLAWIVYSTGDLTPDPAHSAFESLVARGFYPEAADAYRAHLAACPGDHLARIKLAAICREHLGDPAGAERLYLEVRRAQPTPRLEFLVGNLLIELYRAEGRHDRLVVELARFADRWKRTRAGREAARALRALKEERDRQAREPTEPGGGA